MFFQSVALTTPTETQHSNKSHFTISKELGKFSFDIRHAVLHLFTASLLHYCFHDICVFCTSLPSDRNPQIAQKKILVFFPLLNLLGGSANVALIHLGGKSERVQCLPEALLLGADVDEHQGL